MAQASEWGLADDDLIDVGRCRYAVTSWLHLVLLKGELIIIFYVSVDPHDIFLCAIKEYRLFHPFVK